MIQISDVELWLLNNYYRNERTKPEIEISSTTPVKSTGGTKPRLRGISNPPYGGFGKFRSREFILLAYRQKQSFCGINF
jgi:hypothetical protein